MTNFCLWLCCRSLKNFSHVEGLDLSWNLIIWLPLTNPMKTAIDPRSRWTLIMLHIFQLTPHWIFLGRNGATLSFSLMKYFLCLQPSRPLKLCDTWRNFLNCLLVNELDLDRHFLNNWIIKRAQRNTYEQHQLTTHGSAESVRSACRPKEGHVIQKIKATVLSHFILLLALENFSFAPILKHNGDYYLRFTTIPTEKNWRVEKIGILKAF
jgi:hypothetical protein